MRMPTVLLVLLTCGSSFAETLTLSADQRPGWLRRDGIVMAGSWEPLLFRVRRDGSNGYTPSAEQLAAYRREQSPEMVDRLKSLGVNFVMMHAYKAFGLEVERESMADAVRFAKLCHEAGMRVGVYNNSGTIGWELFYRERPDSKDWVVLDHEGKPVTYGKATYRYYWNRNHPDAIAFYKNIIKFSVEQIKTDLLHFDNYAVGPGYDACSIERFRKYLSESFTPQQRKTMGVTDPVTVRPPPPDKMDTFLARAWKVFCCQSLADSYWDLTRYARDLRPGILTECNPGGINERIDPPIDHGRLLPGGDAFWDEGRQIGLIDGKLHTRIRTYKVARGMGNMAFAYSTSPLEAAESMAFNLDCFGCICWFEFGRLDAAPGVREPVSPDLAPYVRFFHERRDLLRDARVVADVGVLRSFPSMALAPRKNAELTARVEQSLIENRVPFQILHDGQLGEVKRYKVLVLAGCVALSDDQVVKISEYVHSGGRLCVIGPVATDDEWLNPRSKPAFDSLSGENVARIDEKGDPLAAVRQALADRWSVSISGPLGLCAELTEQSNRRLIHLVNYNANALSQDVHIRLRLPEGARAARATWATPDLTPHDTEVAHQTESGIVTFTVPGVKIYTIASIELQ